MHKLTITSWHAMRPNETCVTSVELSAEEYAQINKHGAFALSDATLRRLPSVGSWLSFDLATPIPRDMHNGVWAARQLAYASHPLDIVVNVDGPTLIRNVALHMPSYTRVRGLA